MYKTLKPTGATNGKFIVTSVRLEDYKGPYASGASFHFDDGHIAASFHSFKAPMGHYTFTGMVPSGLKGNFTSVKQTIDAVLALNTCDQA